MIENLTLITASQTGTETAESILNWLISKISANLNLDPAQIGRDQPFATYALGSVQSVSLVAELEDWLGCKLPATLLWDYPTLGEVANLLAQPDADVC